MKPRAVWFRALLACVAAGVACTLVLVARQADPMYPLSDEALIELSTREALAGRQLLGAYSRFGWNHPGPLLFYVLAPFYALSGYATSGLNAGSLAINLTALVGCVWVLLRFGGAALTISFAVIASLYLSRLTEILASSWNAHVDVLMCAAVIVMASAVASGRIGLVPLLLLATSFVVQSHVAVLPLAVAACVLALAPHVVDVSGRRALSGYANVTAWILIVVWLPPVAEQLIGASGNIGRMWWFIQHPGMEPAPLADAYSAWARMLTSAVRGTVTLPGLPHAADRSAWALAAAPVELLLLAGVAIWARRRRRPVHMWLAVQSCTAALVALVAVVRKPGDILDHEIFWITAIGVVAATAIVGAALAVAGQRMARAHWLANPAAATIAVLLMGAVVVEGFQQLGAVVSRSRRINDYDRLVRNGAHAIEQALVRMDAQRARFVIDGRVWDSAAGMILQLVKRGIVVVLDDETQVARYPGTLRADGTEDAEVHFCGGPCHEEQIARPGNIVVFEAPGAIAIDARAKGT